MFIFDSINAKDFSSMFVHMMDEAYFELFQSDFNADALLTHFYFS